MVTGWEHGGNPHSGFAGTQVMKPDLSREGKKMEFCSDMGPILNEEQVPENNCSSLVSVPWRKTEELGAQGTLVEGC